MKAEVLVPAVAAPAAEVIMAAVTKVVQAVGTMAEAPAEVVPAVDREVARAVIGKMLIRPDMQAVPVKEMFQAQPVVRAQGHVGQIILIPRIIHRVQRAGKVPTGKILPVGNKVKRRDGMGRVCLPVYVNVPT